MRIHQAGKTREREGEPQRMNDGSVEKEISDPSLFLVPFFSHHHHNHHHAHHLPLIMSP